MEIVQFLANFAKSGPLYPQRWQEGHFAQNVCSLCSVSHLHWFLQRLLITHVRVLNLNLSTSKLFHCLMSSDSSVLFSCSLTSLIPLLPARIQMTRNINRLVSDSHKPESVNRIVFHHEVSFPHLQYVNTEFQQFLKELSKAIYTSCVKSCQTGVFPLHGWFELV